VDVTCRMYSVFLSRRGVRSLDSTSRLSHYTNAVACQTNGNVEMLSEAHGSKFDAWSAAMRAVF
jgi:hypothetical protein